MAEPRCPTAETDDDEYPGFPADVCPEDMPDVSKHHSVMADILKRCPDLYGRLRLRRTRSGVSLAKCIKTGMDNRGHPMIKMLGLVAGDGECYEEFRELFDAVIENRFGVGSAANTNIVDFSPEKLTPTRADDSGKYVLSTQIRVARNLKGVPFPPAMNVQQLQDVECALATALLELTGPLQGDYCRLEEAENGSCTEDAAETVENLRRLNLLFECPDSTVALCSGYGRHWPCGRGVFVNDLQDFSVWVNEAEHLRAIVLRPGDAAQHGFTELKRGLDSISASLARHGSMASEYEYSDRLGFLTSCPSNLGTALRISFVVLLPLLMEKGGVTQWCAQRKIILRNSLDSSGAQIHGMVEVSNAERLGLSEVDTVNNVIEAVAELVRAEQRLEVGEAGLEAASFPQRAQSGCSGSPADLDPAVHGANGSRMSPAESANSEARTAATWDVAGDTLSLIFAGAISSEEVRDACSNPEAMASAQSAPHQDAASPEQDLIDKLPSAEAAAVCTLGGLELLRDKVFVALTDAADNGSLDEILASAREVSDATTRIDDFTLGGDTSMGVASATVATTEVPADIDNLRIMARDLLFQSAEDGRLDRAFAGRHVDDSGERELEQTRVRMRNMLESSLRNGFLEQALAEISPPVGQQPAASVQGDGVDKLHIQKRSGLDEVAKDGSCAHVLGAHKDDDLGGVREKMKDLLEGALHDGTLDHLLLTRPSGDANTAHGEQVHTQDGSIDAVRDRMRNMLENAVDAGNLEDLLRKSPEPAEGDVRSGVRGVLEEALGNGSQEAVLASPRVCVEEEEPPVEQTRSLMKEILELSLEDGTLDKVTEQIATESQALRRLQKEQEAVPVSEAESHPRDIEGTRQLMRGVLEMSLDGGSLEQVIQDVQSQSQSLRNCKKQLDETGEPPQGQQSSTKSMEGMSLATTAVPPKALTLGTLCEQDCLEMSRLGGGLPGLQGSLVLSSPWAFSEPPVVRDLAQEFNAALASEGGGICSAPGSASSEALAKLMLARGIRPPALAEALLQCDRKIGALTVAVREAQRQLDERDKQAARMEAEIRSVKEEAKLLSQQIEQRKNALDDAETLNMQLRESRRQLSNGLDEELLKQRKIGIGLDSSMQTARSDLSTACGLSDVGTPPQQATYPPKQIAGATPPAVFNAITAS